MSVNTLGSLGWFERTVVRESIRQYYHELTGAPSVAKTLGNNAATSSTSTNSPVTDRPFHPFRSIEVFYRNMVEAYTDPRTGQLEIRIAEDCHAQQVVSYHYSSNIYGDLDSLFCFVMEFYTAHYHRHTNRLGREGKSEVEKEPLLIPRQRELLIYHWTLGLSLEETAGKIGVSVFEAKFLKNDALIKLRDFVFYDNNRYTWDVHSAVIRPKSLYAQLYEAKGKPLPQAKRRGRGRPHKLAGLGHLQRGEHEQNGLGQIAAKGRVRERAGNSKSREQARSHWDTNGYQGHDQATTCAS